jgi:hypothetical protein
MVVERLNNRGDFEMKVRELLSGPEKWTKRENARNKERLRCRESDPEAVCWCLIGAVNYCYGACSLQAQTIRKSLRAMVGAKTVAGICDWNDAHERKFEEVKALVDELDI